MKLLLVSILILLGNNGYVQQKNNYPIPKTKNLLFYIQRNHNENAIVYDAVYDKDGKLNPDKPVEAYWIRFQEYGQRMELRYYERWMAYGIKAEKSDNPNYDYRLYLSASDKVVLWLKQIAPFKSIVITEINGKPVRLDHLFATLDESGWIPKVLYGEFYAYYLDNNKAAYKKVFPKDIK